MASTVMFAFLGGAAYLLHKVLPSWVEDNFSVYGNLVLLLAGLVALAATLCQYPQWVLGRLLGEQVVARMGMVAVGDDELVPLMREPHG
jgi:hypothetical protein